MDTEKPSFIFKRRFFSKENIWVLLLSYIGSIFIARFSMYFFCVTHGLYCGSVIKGVHYHHYAWGFLLVLVGLLLFWRFRDLFSVILVGIGNGFIFDELIMIFFGEDPIGGWSPWNIIPITGGLIILNIVFMLVHQGAGVGPKEFDLEYLTRHLGRIARFGEKVLFSKFGPVKGDRYAVTKFGYLVTIIIFVLLILLILYASEERLEGAVRLMALVAM